ncbi:MAG: YceI family protein, partial [Candidatus Kapabacteria bacterium]|nr:YceI family protein [Candidatus Kapabacteria bacterium]
IIFLLFAFNIANAQEYQVDKSKKNLVKFTSEMPVESFDGVTNKIDGYLYMKSDNLKDAEIYFEVDLNSVDTGIGLRNRHMREDYLHTDKYQFTNFKGNLTTIKEVSQTEFDVVASGKMFIHGVTREISINGKIYKVPNGYQLKSQFIVKLTDYNIKVPKFMFVRISEDIQLTLDFFVKSKN